MYKACPNCGHLNSEWSRLPDDCVNCNAKTTTMKPKFFVCFNLPEGEFCELTVEADSLGEAVAKAEAEFKAGYNMEILSATVEKL